MTAIQTTSPSYRAGQRALLDAVAGGRAPNFALAELLGAEFAAGFTDQWNEISRNGEYLVSQCVELADRLFDSFDYDGV